MVNPFPQRFLQPSVPMNHYSTSFDHGTNIVIGDINLDLMH